MTAKYKVKPGVVLPFGLDFTGMELEQAGISGLVPDAVVLIQPAKDSKGRPSGGLITIKKSDLTFVKGSAPTINLGVTEQQVACINDTIGNLERQMDSVGGTAVGDFVRKEVSEHICDIRSLLRTGKVRSDDKR